MRRIKIIVEFDGTNFSGVQVQGKGERTVQGELEAAISKLPGGIPTAIMCGRTDAGVHGIGMPFHFDIEDHNIPDEKFSFAINTFLPPDIRVHHAEEVDANFHARKSCYWREYRYRILMRRTPTAIDQHRVWWVPQTLNLIPMRHALEHLQGTHDFRAFAIKEERSTVREIYRAHLEVWPVDNGREIWITFVGSGFLRGQVRTMVGTLVEVGLGKRDSRNIIELLRNGTRKDAAATCPPQGLYFVKAGYTPHSQ